MKVILERKGKKDVVINGKIKAFTEAILFTSKENKISRVWSIRDNKKSGIIEEYTPKLFKRFKK